MYANGGAGRPLPGMEETEKRRLSTDFPEREEEPGKDS
jgi:hypothetical protein